eukprot:6321120-Lingulodinium_polyedra.AAC.1
MPRRPLTLARPSKPPPPNPWPKPRVSKRPDLRPPWLVPGPWPLGLWPPPDPDPPGPCARPFPDP